MTHEGSSPPENWRDQLVVQARGGSRNALNVLFADVRDQLRRKVARLLPVAIRRKEDSSDLAQMTFLQAWKLFPTFQGDTFADFRAWLFTIERNQLRHLIRWYATGKRQIKQELSLEGELSGQRLEDSLADECPTPLDEAAEREMEANLGRSESGLAEDGPTPHDRRQIVRRDRAFVKRLRMDRAEGLGAILWQTEQFPPPRKK